MFFVFIPLISIIWSPTYVQKIMDHLILFFNYNKISSILGSEENFISWQLEKFVIGQKYEKIQAFFKIRNLRSWVTKILESWRNL